ncbi:MAG: DUF4358 domain-containing protein [Clostridia bacterium]|nr:DUF4358 domain-containing protein [Clostridia bacterium]
MKKLFALLLALLMVATCFTGCFGSKNDVTDDTESVEDSVSEDMGDVVVDDTQDTADEDGAKYTVDIALTESNPDAETNDVSTADIAAGVKELLGEYYLPSMPLDNEFLAETYGVKAEWIDNFYAEVPMIGFHPDALIAVKAAEGQADNVEAALNDFLTYNKESALQYPANLPKVNAARVYRLGDYVFYILLAAVPDEFMDNEEGAFDFAVESNENVVKKINEILAK